MLCGDVAGGGGASARKQPHSRGASESTGSRRHAAHSERSPDVASRGDLQEIVRLTAHGNESNSYSPDVLQLKEQMDLMRREFNDRLNEADAERDVLRRQCKRLQRHINAEPVSYSSSSSMASAEDVHPSASPTDCLGGDLTQHQPSLPMGPASSGSTWEVSSISRQGCARFKPLKRPGNRNSSCSFRPSLPQALNTCGTVHPMQERLVDLGLSMPAADVALQHLASWLTCPEGAAAVAAAEANAFAAGQPVLRVGDHVRCSGLQQGDSSDEDFAWGEPPPYGPAPLPYGTAYAPVFSRRSRRQPASSNSHEASSKHSERLQSSWRSVRSARALKRRWASSHAPGLGMLGDKEGVLTAYDSMSGRWKVTFPDGTNRWLQPEFLESQSLPCTRKFRSMQGMPQHRRASTTSSTLATFDIDFDADEHPDSNFGLSDKQIEELMRRYNDSRHRALTTTSGLSIDASDGDFGLADYQLGLPGDAGNVGNAGNAGNSTGDRPSAPPPWAHKGSLAGIPVFSLDRRISENSVPTMPCLLVSSDQTITEDLLPAPELDSDDDSIAAETDSVWSLDWTNVRATPRSHVPTPGSRVPGQAPKVNTPRRKLSGGSDPESPRLRASPASDVSTALSEGLQVRRQPTSPSLRFVCKEEHPVLHIPSRDQMRAKMAARRSLIGEGEFCNPFEAKAGLSESFTPRKDSSTAGIPEEGDDETQETEEGDDVTQETEEGDDVTQETEQGDDVMQESVEEMFQSCFFNEFNAETNAEIDAFLQNLSPNRNGGLPEIPELPLKFL